jgi:hypothetical protein
LGQFFISWQQKKNWKKLGIFVFKGKLDPKMFNFFEKNTKLSKLQNQKNNNNKNKKLLL